jgi:hypothetical protein
VGFQLDFVYHHESHPLGAATPVHTSFAADYDIGQFNNLTGWDQHPTGFV